MSNKLLETTDPMLYIAQSDQSLRRNGYMDCRRHCLGWTRGWRLFAEREDCQLPSLEVILDPDAMELGGLLVAGANVLRMGFG